MLLISVFHSIPLLRELILSYFCVGVSFITRDLINCLVALWNEISLSFFWFKPEKERTTTALGNEHEDPIQIATV